MRVMLNVNKVAKVIGFIALLGACSGTTEQNAQNVPPPSNDRIAQIAQQAYQYKFGRSAENLSVNEVKYERVFLSGTELVACVSATEREIGNVYDNSGNITSPIGTKYTKNYIMLMRPFSAGWNSGIFRAVSGGKIGNVAINGICQGK